MNTAIPSAATINTRPMLVITAAAGLVVIVPLLWMRPPWFIAWAIVLVLPHVLIAVRVNRAALDPAGSALALGVCAAMIVAGAVFIATQWHRAEWLPHLCAVALVATYTAMAKTALVLYKSGTRTKPHWRHLGRGLADAFVYYVIVFVIAAGVRMHLD